MSDQLFPSADGDLSRCKILELQSLAIHNPMNISLANKLDRLSTAHTHIDLVRSKHKRHRRSQYYCDLIPRLRAPRYQSNVAPLGHRQPSPSAYGERLHLESVAGPQATTVDHSDTQAPITFSQSGKADHG